MLETAFQQVVDSIGVDLIEFGQPGYYYAIHVPEDFEYVLGCVENMRDAEWIQPLLSQHYGIYVEFTDVEMW